MVSMKDPFSHHSTDEIPIGSTGMNTVSAVAPGQRRGYVANNGSANPPHEWATIA